jgi:hypothetical protein
MPAERGQRRPQRRTIGDRGDSANAAIGVPAILADRPHLDAGALRFGREVLFIGGRGQVRDGDVRMADDFGLPHDSRTMIPCASTLGRAQRLISACVAGPQRELSIEGRR